MATEEDRLDAEIAQMFDEVKEVHVEMVNGKPRVPDEQTIAEMERDEAARRVEEACGVFLTAERRFQKLSALPDVVSDPKVNLAWWEAAPPLVCQPQKPFGKSVRYVRQTGNEIESELVCCFGRL